MVCFGGKLKVLFFGSTGKAEGTAPDDEEDDMWPLPMEAEGEEVLEALEATEARGRKFAGVGELRGRGGPLIFGAAKSRGELMVLRLEGV